MNQVVVAQGKGAEARLREAYGCPTGDLHDDVGFILRHQTIKGKKFDHNSDTFAQDVDKHTTSDRYQEKGLCQPFEIAPELTVEEKINNKLDDDISRFSAKSTVRTQDLDLDIRKNIKDKKTRNFAVKQTVRPVLRLKK